MSERMSEERWEELRKFDVGDPATWPAVEIDYGELLAEINALRAELTKAERGRNEIHADFTELESEGLRLQGLWLADIAKAERERDEARAALAQAREQIAILRPHSASASSIGAGAAEWPMQLLAVQVLRPHPHPGERNTMTWHRIDDPENPAPKDGTIIEVRAGGMEFPAHFDFVCWESDGGGLAEGEEDAPLHAWCATTDEHPDDWDDGICWGVNGDGNPSSKPTAWRHFPEPPRP